MTEEERLFEVRNDILPKLVEMIIEAGGDSIYAGPFAMILLKGLIVSIICSIDGYDTQEQAMEKLFAEVTESIPRFRQTLALHDAEPAGSA